jgi:ATP-dependent Clp protease ATP-binding subunit ClpC
MPTLEWEVLLLENKLDETFTVSQPLLLPEISTFDTKTSRLRASVVKLARQLLEQEPAIAIHQRVLPDAPQVDVIQITLAPPQPRMLDWTEPVELRFNVVCWKHGNDSWRALVPQLNIEVVARREAELPQRLAEQIASTLKRTKLAQSLFSLAMTQRCSELSLTPATIKIRYRTAKQVARRDEEEHEGSAKLIIHDTGQVLDEAPLKPAYEIEEIVAQLADAMSDQVPRSVLLVGSSGAGKSALVRELVRQRAKFGLASRPFWATSGSRLIAGMSGYGMWQQRCQKLCKEAAAHNAILDLGNLIELMQVGRAGGSQGVAGFFKSPLSRGDIVVIVECTPEQLTLIDRHDPHLLSLFQQIKIEEPPAATVRQILRLASKTLAGPVPGLTDDALETVDHLHRRYATYSAAPGRPLRFLQNLLQDRHGDEPINSAQVVGAFSRETGLPLSMLDPDIPLDLQKVRDWFAERLIAQSRAVNVVTDLLATVKASMTRPGRPIASLLFVGPTGVGKTEMAKALAEYFFGDRNRLTRFDMSEFATPAQVQRLIGGIFGTEGLLTTKVREQPFSVILFDEFEKAYPSFFDLLLQVLGDGRLTDAAGRVGDFSNTIIIMTSNLGAESFGRGSFGLNRTSAETNALDHFVDTVRDFLRPEMFNRIDRIVPFLPLDSAAILQITRRELSLIQERDGLKMRGVVLEVCAEAEQHLADRGYDVRYGARPLKRQIERQLLAPLADAVNQYPPDLRLHAQGVLQDGDLQVTVRALVDEQGRTASTAASAANTADAAEACALLRRDVQRLVTCPTVLTVTNLLFQLERSQKRAEQIAKARQKHYFDPVLAEQIRTLAELLQTVRTLQTDVNALEDSILSTVYSDERAISADIQNQLPELHSHLEEMLLVLLARQLRTPHFVLLGVFGHLTTMPSLALAYVEIARARGFTVDVCWYETHGRDNFRRHRTDDPVKLLAEPPRGLVGISLAVKGLYAWLHFAGERGIHILTRDSSSWGCLVDVSDQSLHNYAPPGVEKWPSDLSGIDARRSYDLTRGIAKDQELKKELRWSGRSLEAVVRAAAEQNLRRIMRAVIES